MVVPQKLRNLELTVGYKMVRFSAIECENHKCNGKRRCWLPGRNKIANPNSGREFFQDGAQLVATTKKPITHSAGLYFQIAPDYSLIQSFVSNFSALNPRAKMLDKNNDPVSLGYHRDGWTHGPVLHRFFKQSFVAVGASFQCASVVCIATCHTCILNQPCKLLIGGFLVPPQNTGFTFRQGC